MNQMLNHPSRFGAIPARVLALLGALLLTGATVSAQTTVINSFSTDIVAEKKLYAEFDVFSTPSSHQVGGFQVYIPRLVYGVSKNVEVGFNATFTDALTPQQPVEIQPNIKWRFYNNEDKGVAASGGFIYYTIVHNRAGSDSFGLFYSNLSKKFKSDYGPRFTVGGYGLVGRTDGAGPKGGVTLAYEQPLHSKVSWVTDWLSGQNRFGYASTGLSIVPNSKTSIGMTYSFGNYGRGNHGIFSWVGYTF
jgi:hypothetical protein